MSSPLQLPVRASEAVALAELVFRLAATEAASHPPREKLRSSLPLLGNLQLRVKPHTLSTDPIHAQTFYIVVENSAQEAWLLHMAPASAPESTLFPKPLLIARVRPQGEREIIVNAIPVAEHLETIVTALAPHLLARSSSVHHLWSVPAEADLAAFLTRVPKRPNILPAVRSLTSSWRPYLPLLLSNWKDGFVYIWEDLLEPPSIEQARPFSRFSFLLPTTEDPRGIAEKLTHFRAALGRSVDFEFDFRSLAPQDPKNLLSFLDSVRLMGITVQSIAVPSWIDPSTLDLHLPTGLTITALEPEATPLRGRIHWRLPELL